jgi:DNA segregation ATPase FtsK/SpoIIIE, S-DNA-T family
MGRRKKEKKNFDDNNKDNQNQKNNFWVALKKETTEGILAILFIIISFFLILAPFNKAGFVGEKVYVFFDFLFGIGYYLLPLILLVLGISFIKSLSHNLAWPKILGAVLFVISGISLIDILFEKGGVIGNIIGTPLLKLFDFWVSLFGLIGLLIISILILFDTSLKMSFIERFLNRNKVKETSSTLTEDEDKKILVKQNDAEQKDEDVPVVKPKITEPENVPQKQTGLIFLSKKSDHFKTYVNPPISLLEKDSGKPEVGDIKANANIIKRTLANFGILVEMDEVSVGPSVTRYALKPAEGVKLSKIVGLKNDLSLALAAHPLRIEAPIPGKSLVGIEIPNSSKTTVGLGSLFKHPDFADSPKPLLIGLGKGVTGQSYFADLSKMPHMLIAGTTGSGKSVTIHTLITSLLFRNSPETLKFIMVDPKRVELTLYNKIPHLLTPVITDAKKAILALKWAANEMSRRYDLLEKNGVRDIASYHKNVLEPALEKAKKNKDETAELPETMPFIVIIIDELADIMQAYPRELEAGIVRLAQMSRAVGIHLIISTQRPSVNVITGLIKANIPSRVALQVASQIDSRTILDMPGAETLLGAGDMLFLSGDMAQPRRIQSAFIREEEVKRVVEFLIKNHENELPEGGINFEAQKEAENRTDIFNSLNSDGSGGGNGGVGGGFFGADDEDEDDLYGQAKEIVISAGKASTSYLQRKLRIGYSRAARLMDLLEEKGVIGASDGAKPREVLVGGANQADVADDDNENQNN